MMLALWQDELLWYLKSKFYVLICDTTGCSYYSQSFLYVQSCENKVEQYDPEMFKIVCFVEMEHNNIEMFVWKW